MPKFQTVSHEVNGVLVAQRITDGFINGTTMCVAHGKDINDWLRLEGTYELFSVLADSLGIISNMAFSRDSGVARLSATKYGEIFPTLLFVKRGSPENGGGTWLHYDLAIQLAQWCSPAFAIRVSRWIREWITTGRNPVLDQNDIDRVVYRDVLKDESRNRMCNQVKAYLEQIKRYDDKKFSGIYFARVHDGINLAITGETAKQMRTRLSDFLGRQVKEAELIRDWFPPLELSRYISVCEAAANYMLRDQLDPMTALEEAIKYTLPANYLAKEIDFVEHIKFVRQRLSQPLIGSDFKSLGSF